MGGRYDLHLDRRRMVIRRQRVLDLFSRMVVGWSMAAIQDATLVTQALRMAVTRRRPQAGLLHHSDRGSTYTSQDYQSLLQQEGMRISMSRTADCYDNA